MPPFVFTTPWGLRYWGVGISLTDSGFVTAITVGSISRSSLKEIPIHVALEGRGQISRVAKGKAGQLEWSDEETVYFDTLDRYQTRLVPGNAGYLWQAVHLAALPNHVANWKIGDHLLFFTPALGGGGEDPEALRVVIQRMSDATKMPILPEWWPALLAKLRARGYDAPCQTIGKAPALTRWLVPVKQFEAWVLDVAHDDSLKEAA